MTDTPWSDPGAVGPEPAEAPLAAAASTAGTKHFAAGPGYGTAPLPLPPPPPIVGPSSDQMARLPTKVRPSWIVASVLVAIATDFAIRRAPWNNIAGTLLVLTLIGGLVGSGLVRSRSGRTALALAAVFGVFLSLRTDPRLIAFNLMAIGGLLFVAAVRPRDFFDYRPFQAVADLANSAIQPFVLAAELPEELSARRRANRAAGTSRSVVSTTASAIARGLVFAAPAVGVLALLLASADVVFASFFRSPISLGSALGHLVAAAVGVGLMAVLLRLAHDEPKTVDSPVGPRLGRVETFVVLGAINLLFAAFAVAQLVALTDAGASTLAEQGLTYKEYARQGFFQLLWVAGITLALLVTIRTVTISWARESRLFRVLGLVSVSLTLVIVAVAFGRLQFYVSDGGFTPLRFYSTVFSLWVGLGFVLVGLRLMNYRASASWMMPGLFASGLAVLFVLNLANPEAIMARDLLDLDKGAMLLHMDKLTADGQAELADGTDRLSPELRAEVEAKLCRIDTGGDHGWLDWNLGKAKARSQLNSLCPT